MTGGVIDRHECGSCRSRRAVLLAGGSIAGAALAGCLGDDDDAEVSPTDLSDGVSCDVCGMVVADHFGPAVQAFYSNGPAGSDAGTVVTDSVREFVVLHEEKMGGDTRLQGAFVTDYSMIEYDVITAEHAPHLTSHVGVNDFAAITELSFVVESELRGAMGEDAFPFSDHDEGDAVAAEFDGVLVDWDKLASVFLE